METEKFQNLVLEHLANLTQELTEVKTDLKDLKQNQSRMEDMLGTMVTKDEINRALTENQKDVLAMLQHIDKKIDKQNEQLEDKFEVMNDRLFKQETQLCRIKKQAK